MTQLIHNCPNCGAPLEADGYCKYCKTKIRYANELDIESFGKFGLSAVEILLKIKDGDSIILLPVRGYIPAISVSLRSDAITCDDVMGSSYMYRPSTSEVEFEFQGYIINEERNE